MSTTAMIPSEQADFAIYDVPEILQSIRIPHYKVFGSIGIVKAILLHLPHRDLLFSIKVSKLFRAAVDSSIPWQEKLFWVAKTDTGERSYHLEFNPFFFDKSGKRAAFWNDNLGDHMGMQIPISIRLHRVSFRATSQLSSCFRMLATQPPRMKATMMSSDPATLQHFTIRHEEEPDMPVTIYGLTKLIQERNLLEMNYPMSDGTFVVPDDPRFEEMGVSDTDQEGWTDDDSLSGGDGEDEDGQQELSGGQGGESGGADMTEQQGQ